VKKKILAVVIYNTHTEAEAASQELQDAGTRHETAVDCRQGFKPKTMSSATTATA
jgi:hypothetical protein